MQQVAGTNVFTLNAEAATDLSGNGNLHHAIVVDADGDAVLGGATGTGYDMAGFLDDGGIGAGDPVTVVALGGSVARAGGALDEGDYCGVAADAEIVQVQAANEIIVFQTLQAAADQDLPWGLVVRMQSVDGKP